MRLFSRVLTGESWGENEGWEQSGNWILQAFVFNGLEWRRGWDSHHPTLLQTQDLADFGFLQIRQNRTKAWVDARIAHAERSPEASADHHVGAAGPRGRGFTTISTSRARSTEESHEAVERGPGQPALNEPTPLGRAPKRYAGGEAIGIVRLLVGCRLLQPDRRVVPPRERANGRCAILAPGDRGSGCFPPHRAQRGECHIVDRSTHHAPELVVACCTRSCMPASRASL